jgi:hypothetical protein
VCGVDAHVFIDMNAASTSTVAAPACTQHLHVRRCRGRDRLLRFLLEAGCSASLLKPPSPPPPPPSLPLLELLALLVPLPSSFGFCLRCFLAPFACDCCCFYKLSLPLRQ